MPQQKGLMFQAQGQTEVDDGDEELKSVDSDLVYNSAQQMLQVPQMKEQALSVIQGASDVGQAIGKMAAVIITRITDELDSRKMPIANSSVLGESGALAKVLTAIYQMANESGLQLAMEDSLIQAYEAAEADLDNMYG